MNVQSIQNRLDRVVKKMPPLPVTRESIEVNIRSLGLDVEATWRFICAEGLGAGQLRQMALRGDLIAAIDSYRGVTGSYHNRPI